MGYTHYTEMRKEVPQDKLDAAIKGIQLVVKKAKADGIIAGWDSDVDEDVEDSETRIAFNGIGDEGHETFEVYKKSERYASGKTFDFCKTARKEYDKVVVACLLLLKDHLGDYIEVSSDGNMKRGGDWDEGKAYLDSIMKKGCKHCGEQENLHKNYNHEDKTVDEILCNECGKFTPVAKGVA